MDAQTLIPAFFPLSQPGSKISLSFQGVIFGAFSAGNALAAPFVAPLMVRWGIKRCIISGLLGMIVFTILFGTVPFVFSSATALPIAFSVYAFLYGATSSMAETGIFSILATKYAASLAKIMAAAETAMGFGALLGPLSGGAAYDFANTHWDGNVSFLFPFLLAAAIPLICLAIVSLSFPTELAADEDEDEDENENEASVRDKLLEPQVVAICVCMLVATTVITTLDPTLEVRLSQQVGMFK
jgi:MFS family permease